MLKTSKKPLAYGQTDGEHHKMWVIDQMLCALLGNAKYEVVIKLYGEYDWEPHE